MDREEAIRCFWYFSNVADSGNNVVALTRRDKEAFNMAIEVLEQEPCDDCISRQATLEPYKVLENTDTLCVALIRANIKQQPTVTPKQKIGRWIREKKHHKDDFQEFDYWDVRCSECGAKKRIGWTNIRHCPMCGAKMEESK